MQLNYIKIKSKEMKNMIQNESYLELEEARDGRGRGSHLIGSRLL